MLFSNQTVSDYINEHFEPTWQSVRPVPTVTIDFGNGYTIQRTLNGNIATYVCTAEGTVLDILPGIYEPDTYLAQLEQLALLVRYAKRNTGASLSDYHQQQAGALEAGRPLLRLEEFEIPAGAIFAAEDGVRIILTSSTVQQRAARFERRKGERPVLPPGEDLAQWQALQQDTQINERQRRLQIHRYLAERPSTTPAAMTKWLYREVLHADLDDPYLGLGKLLFENDPFGG